MGDAETDVAEVLARLGVVLDQRDEARAEAERLMAQRAAVLDVLRARWHNTCRWEHPLPVAPWLREAMAALGVEGPLCDCYLCSGADERRARDRREAVSP